VGGKPNQLGLISLSKVVGQLRDTWIVEGVGDCQLNENDWSFDLVGRS